MNRCLCGTEFTANRSDQKRCPECRHTAQIEKHRRHNARTHGIIPDEGYMLLQQAKADARERARLARLAMYEAHEARGQKAS